MDLQLAGKVFIVTGGTDGLGAALADGLVAEQAHVVVCGRNEERVRATEARLQVSAAHSGGAAIGVVADVTKLFDLEGLVTVAIEAWNRIDGVVNNAGKSSAAGIEGATDAEWLADLDLKVLAAVRLVRAALPHLRAAGGGSIVNVLNIGAKAPGAASMPTAASRAAGLALTKAWSKELGADNIRANAVLIGLMESGQWRRRSEATGEDLSEMYADMGRTVPLGRVGRGDEFADLVSYLLSPRSSYVTGSAINLDGGASPVV
jgi:NAD(P)-dependent dehydrogenase (short-subunit alcohol dehydrogenase family)